MAFLVSPGVEVKEIDLTNIVPAVSTSIGAYAGHFNWGPVGDVVNLGSEKELSRYFGAPTPATAQSYFTASTFLRYGDTLLVSRAIDKDTALNATTGNADGVVAAGGQNDNGTLPFFIANIEQYRLIRAEYLDSNFYARCAGTYGNSLKVMIQPADTPLRYNITQLEIVDSADAYGATETTSGKAVKITVEDPNNILDNGLEVTLRAIRSREDWINDLENSPTSFYIGNETPDAESNSKTFILYTSWELGTGNVYDPDGGYPAGYTGNLTPDVGDPGSVVVVEELSRGFMFSPPETEDFETSFVTQPGTSLYAAEYGASNDEIHILVVDVDGLFSERPGTIIERFANLSVAPDAKNEDGSSIYYKDVINTSSKYIIADNLVGIIDNADEEILNLTDNGQNQFDFTSSFDGSVWYKQMQGGVNGDTSNGNVYEALELFTDAETLDLNLIFAENDTEANITIANRLIRIAEARKDCVCFISPDLEVKDQPSDDAKLDKVLSKFDRLPSTNYAVFDSSPLYIYDKYNDEYIWIPASGTIAGLCARTDDVRDPWWSPAGYNRGQLLGVAKLAFNPLQNHRDELYKSRVNPIVAFPGEGIILFGDKTAQAKPSAFDRINVRRLFIVLEKAIATAAKYYLFEFNDEFTRASFKNLVEPYLRDIQGRRGITDFLVVCDETNNTPEVIDSNRFIADIYIKPARSINFITLNFVATRTGVAFEEVVGKF